MPLIAVRMIGVGEKTGRLDETCMYLGDYFEDEVDTASKNLSTVLEPIVLICVGLIVAFIALSIIGPIYQFTGSIKR
jgi:type IV pilus assembly protein PilC